MKSLSSVRILYVLAAVYDGLLGLAFLAAAPQIFARAGITPPNHWGFLHFSAGILVIFGWMFLAIALHPMENRNMILYGMLLKACYVLTVLWYQFHGGVPVLWIYFAIADVIFLMLFFWSQARLGAMAESGGQGAPQSA